MPSAGDRLATYRARVDWGQAGDFSGTYDDVTPDVLMASSAATDGVSISGYGRDQARALAPPQQPTLDLVLRNDSQRYSIEFAGSPIAGQVRPGRDVEVTATAGADWLMESPDILMDDPGALMDGTLAAALFRGLVDEYDQTSDLGNRTLRITAHGLLGRLAGISVTTDLQLDITTGAAMVLLLAAAGLSAADYDVDQDVIDNGRVLSYWHLDGDDAQSAALLLWSTEGYAAFLGERPDGVIVFQGRNYRSLTDRSLAVQATLLDQPGALYHVGVRVRPGLRDVVNAPYAPITLRAFQSSGVVWSYEPTVTLDSSGAAFVPAQPSDPFRNAVVPSVAGGDFVLSGGTVTVALSRTSGGSTVIEFSGGTPGATISSLRLRAEAYTRTIDYRAVSLIDVSDSQAEFGIQRQQLDCYEGLSPTDAVALCDAIVLAYQQLRPTLEVDVVNADTLHLVQLLTRQVADRIHVVDTWLGLDLDLTIEQIGHRITVGNTHLTTWGCEKVVEANWARYDVDLYGTGLFGQ